MTKTEILKDALFAADKVKKKHYQMYQVHKETYVEKHCMWCNRKISGSIAFCCKGCEYQHDKAMKEYERRQQDKDNRRYAR